MAKNNTIGVLPSTLFRGVDPRPTTSFELAFFSAASSARSSAMRVSESWVSEPSTSERLTVSPISRFKPGSSRRGSLTQTSTPNALARSTMAAANARRAPSSPWFRITVRATRGSSPIVRPSTWSTKLCWSA